METNTNDTETKQPASAGCHRTPCSPSSFSPETDKMWGAYYAGDADNADLSNMMIRLERERNVNRGHLDHLRDAVRAFRDAKGRYHTQKACERLLALLPENA